MRHRFYILFTCPVFGEYHTLAAGDAANVSVLHFGAHAGTHVDAPAHFIPGAPELQSTSLEILIGETHVVEIPTDVMAINEDVIRAAAFPTGAKRLLFKTRNSDFWNEDTGQFRSDYTYISPDGARRLVAEGVRLVGIDYLSVERFKPERHDTHETLLSNGVVIIEGGCGDGAPARTILRTLY